MPNRQVATATEISAKSNRFCCLRVWANAAMVVVLSTFLVVGRASAQENPKPQDQTTQQPSKPAGQNDTTLTKHVENAAMQPVKVFTVLDKTSFFFPDIATSTRRLSTGDKFKLFAANSMSGHAILGAAMGAAVSQADDSPTGRGQGWDAYGERFGSSMARTASSEFFGTFLLASVLAQDPRFYPEVNPSFGQSMKYSVQRLFVTRNDAGRDVANISGLMGPLLAEGLANAYWPDRNRTVGDTFLRYGLDLATKAGGNMLREYWPKFERKLSRARSPEAVVAGQ